MWVALVDSFVNEETEAGRDLTGFKTPGQEVTDIALGLCRLGGNGCPGAEFALGCSCGMTMTMAVTSLGSKQGWVFVSILQATELKLRAAQ